MRTKYNLCSKLWTDLNIDFPEKSIRHCCKTRRDIPISESEIKRLGKNVFDQNEVNQEARYSMVVDDKLPNVCIDCIKEEPNSIRHVWNQWNDMYIEHQKQNLMTDDSYTNFIELNIGSKCDMACVYCGPWSSTTWANELDMVQEDDNMKSSWRELIIENLNKKILDLPKSNCVTYNILGGEPTLLSETYTIINELAKTAGHFDKKPIMMITTNLNTKPKLLNKLINTINQTSHVFEWIISVSIENIGEYAEMVRYHLNWARFESNVVEIKKYADFVYFTTTVSLLSLPKFDKFMTWAFDIMGSDNYLHQWAFSLNSVQDGFSDVAYLKKNQVDINKIKNTYLELSKSSPTDKRHDDVLQHLDNLYNRIGSKNADQHFYQFWKNISRRRGIDYLELSELKEIQSSVIVTDK